MFLIRDVMYCKPGQARPMVQKFQALSKLLEKQGAGKTRILTDVSAKRYWTVVLEVEVPNLQQYMEMAGKSMQMKEFQDAMKGYHDHVDQGKREIYTIES